MDTLFLVAIIIEAIFGIGFLFIPGLMLSLLSSSTLDAIATTFARMFGSAAISFSILLWFARKSDKPEFKKGVIYSLFPYYLVSLIIVVISQLEGLMNAMGWSVIGIHVILLAWFGYFLPRKMEQETRTFPRAGA